MKYLKKYKLFEANKEEFTFNENLIDDLFNLSLDIIDNGYLLLIIIKCGSINICDVNLDHNQKDFHWSVLLSNIDSEYFKNKNINYEFNYYIDPEDLDDSTLKLAVEVEDDIKKMYPDEEIKFNCLAW